MLREHHQVAANRTARVKACVRTTSCLYLGSFRRFPHSQWRSELNIQIRVEPFPMFNSNCFMSIGDNMLWIIICSIDDVTKELKMFFCWCIFSNSTIKPIICYFSPLKQSKISFAWIIFIQFFLTLSNPVKMIVSWCSLGGSISNLFSLIHTHVICQAAAFCYWLVQQL